MLCFPHAGGSASSFYWLSSALRPDVEVWAVQYPGRQDRLREPLVDDIGRLADGLFAALLEYLPPAPAFFGHSMGATVAFEVALRAERRLGTPIPRLIASGRRAPSRRRDENVHRRSDEGLIAEVQELSGTHSELLNDEEARRTYLPVIRNDYRAIETYAPPREQTLSCPITAFVGADDPRVTLDEAEAWDRHTDAGFRMRVFPGGHFYLTERPAETVTSLREALGSATSPLRSEI
ncbi:thioesterase II family protein [Actinoallomurus acaciae]|uniref:Thioesterase II family protein n=1 Tax=Actinoallomurus acaciae TaxID=502577 RepID=A0ABV5YAV5_9ACTN